MTHHLLTLTVVNRSRVLLSIFMQNSSNCSLSKTTLSSSLLSNDLSTCPQYSCPRDLFPMYASDRRQKEVRQKNRLMPTPYEDAGIITDEL